MLFTKRLLALFTLLSFFTTAHTQTGIANYQLTTSVANYLPITGDTTVFSGAYGNAVSGPIPLRSNFIFGGVAFNTCYVSPNGYITFGSGAPNINNITPLSTEAAAISGVISAYGVSGYGSTAPGTSARVGYIREGNEFIIQFQDHSTYYNRNVDRMNFQIRLNMVTYGIRMVYGTCTQLGSSGVYGESQVGIRGNTTNIQTNMSNLYLPNVPAGTSCSWADAVSGYSPTNILIFSPLPYYANIKIPNGLTYTWVAATAPAPCRGFYVIGTTTGTTAVLKWRPAVGATQYNVQYRIPGECNWTNYPGNPISDTSVLLTGLNPGTAYQVRAQSLGIGGASTWSHIPNCNTSNTLTDGYTLNGSFKTLVICAAPTNAAVSSITTTSAVVSFSASGNSFVTEYGPTGFTPGLGANAGNAGTVVNTTGTSASLTGLTPGAAYDVYVRQNCMAAGNGSSANTVKTTFTTISAPCTDTTVPYVENFDGVVAPATPPCIIIQDVNGGNRWQVTALTFPGSTPNNVMQYVGQPTIAGNDWFFTRGLSLTAGTAYKVNFKYYSFAYNADQMEIRIGTAPTAASATAGPQVFSDLNINGGLVRDGAGVFTPATTGIYYFGFHIYSGGTQSGVTLDNIDIRKVAECLMPTAVNVDSITASAARVSFSDTGSSYLVEYGLNGFTPGTGATAGTNGRAVAATGSPFVLTGLNDGKVYDLYVRMRCNASGTLYSPNSTKVTFSTPCQTGDVPYFENFDGAIAPAVSPCIVIKNVNGGNTWQVTDVSGPYNSFSPPNTMVYTQGSTGTANDWFFIKGLNLTAGGVYQISFKVQTLALEVRASTAPVDTIALAGSQILSYNYSGSVPLGGIVSGTFSPTVSGIYYFGFHTFSNPGQGSTYVDDINVALTANCTPVPDAFINNITSTSAQVVFTPSSDSMVVEYGSATFTPGPAAAPGTGGTVIRAINSPVVLSGLLPNQLYKVYIRRKCPAAGSGYSFNRFVDSFYTAPVNDLPAGAITLTVGAGCTGFMYKNQGATKLAAEPGAACSGPQNIGKSVWFKFVAPGSGFVKISTDNGVPTDIDTKISLYQVGDSSRFATFQILACDDDNGMLNPTSSILYAPELVPGQTYYVVVDDYNGTYFMNFCVQVDEMTTSMMAAGGTCTAGQPLPGFNTSYRGWASLTNNNGQLIANIRANTSTTSTDTLSYTPYVTVDTGTVRQSASGEYYLNRNFRIVNPVSGNYDVQFFLLNTELATLQAADSNATSNNLNVTKVKGETACQPNFVSGGAGNDTLLMQTAYGNAAGISWVTVNTSGFSNFYLHSGSRQLSRVYVFTGNGAWSNPANWLNGEVPPAQLPAHCAIEIKPAAGGQCIMDVLQRVPAGSTFRVKSGMSIVVPGLIITQ